MIFRCSSWWRWTDLPAKPIFVIGLTVLSFGKWFGLGWISKSRLTASGLPVNRSRIPWWIVWVCLEVLNLFHMMRWIRLCPISLIESTSTVRNMALLTRILIWISVHSFYFGIATFQIGFNIALPSIIRFRTLNRNRPIKLRIGFVRDILVIYGTLKWS